MARPLRDPWRWLLPAASAPLLLYLIVPVLALLGRAVPGMTPEVLSRPIVIEAMRLSAFSASAALLLVVVFGTPTAYLLARRTFPGKAILDTIVDLPVVLPPAVAGLALLFTFGRRGIFGPILTSVGIEIAFTIVAVILAQAFVAAPFYVRSVRAGFTIVDADVEEAARLDAGPLAVFRGITVPLAMPSIVGGLVLGWAKAVGEFGATILFAGSFLGRTQTLPLAIYQALESDLNAAIAIGALLVVISFAVILIFRRATGGISGPAGA